MPATHAFMQHLRYNSEGAGEFNWCKCLLETWMTLDNRGFQCKNMQVRMLFEYLLFLVSWFSGLSVSWFFGFLASGLPAARLNVVIAILVVEVVVVIIIVVLVLAIIVVIIIVEVSVILAIVVMLVFVIIIVIVVIVAILVIVVIVVAVVPVALVMVVVVVVGGVVIEGLRFVCDATFSKVVSV